MGSWRSLAEFGVPRILDLSFLNCRIFKTVRDFLVLDNLFYRYLVAGDDP